MRKKDKNSSKIKKKVSLSGMHTSSGCMHLFVGHTDYRLTKSSGRLIIEKIDINIICVIHIVHKRSHMIIKPAFTLCYIIGMFRLIGD